MADAHRRVPVAPTTPAGRWAVGFALAFPVLMLAWSFLPGGAALAFAVGLAGGALALWTILRDGERALGVFASVLPLALVVLFVVAELLVGHD